MKTSFLLIQYYYCTSTVLQCFILMSYLFIHVIWVLSSVSIFMLFFIILMLCHLYLLYFVLTFAVSYVYHVLGCQLILFLSFCLYNVVGCRPIWSFILTYDLFFVALFRVVTTRNMRSLNLLPSWNVLISLYRNCFASSRG